MYWNRLIQMELIITKGDIEIWRKQNHFLFKKNHQRNISVLHLKNYLCAFIALISLLFCSSKAKKRFKKQS